MKDQINSHIGSIQQSTTSIPAEKSPISSNFNRAALLKLKESIDNKSTGSASNSALAFNQNIPGSEERQQLSNERPRRQTINLAKLSMVLKTQGKLNVSHKMQDRQQRDFNSIASILTETLSKLKRPNKHFLTPLDQSVLKASKVDSDIGLPVKKA